MTYGYGFWCSGFVALIPWIYSSTTSDPLNYLTGSTMDFLVRHEPDGTPMPVILWEAFREGHDDYRYLYTLEQLIARARASGRVRRGSATPAASCSARHPGAERVANPCRRGAVYSGRRRDRAADPQRIAGGLRLIAGEPAQPRQRPPGIS